MHIAVVQSADRKSRQAETATDETPGERIAIISDQSAGRRNRRLLGIGGPGGYFRAHPRSGERKSSGEEPKGPRGCGCCGEARRSEGLRGLWHGRIDPDYRSEGRIRRGVGRWREAGCGARPPQRRQRELVDDDSRSRRGVSWCGRGKRQETPSVPRHRTHG